MASPLNHAKRERELRERQLNAGVAVVTHIRSVPKKGQSRKGEIVVLRESRGPAFGKCEILDVRIVSDVSQIRETELSKLPAGLNSVEALKECSWATAPRLEVLTLRVL